MLTLNDSDKLEWWVKFRNPKDILEKHPTFLLAEVYMIINAALCLCHALRNGGRYKWLWLTCILQGLTTEMVSYFLPDIDNFWHAQAMVMFAGQRLPLYIMVLYTFFYYTAVVGVSHLRLPWWAEPFAVGISVVLIDIPYDIMGIKLLWWTWHDTDPNIYDRHYWVPWTSYYFHATFAAGMTFVFYGVHRLLAKNEEKLQSAGFFKEALACLLAGILGMPLGVIQFLPVYHPLHDSNEIHTEVCVWIQMAVYVMIMWAGDRKAAVKRHELQEKEKSKKEKRSYFNEIILALVIHYSMYVFLVFTAKPEKQVSVGLHEPIGSCQETTPVYTAFGHVLEKHKYLCVDKYDEAIFDFHCTKKLPKPGQSWYTICGTKFPNHVEYIVIVCGACLFGMAYYWQLLVCSGSQPSGSKLSGSQSSGSQLSGSQSSGSQSWGQKKKKIKQS
ncbi:uncharacterized protein LOC134276426 [Saccostrea cucullata]|uniref:uncharacterized protein LOC134276426 n=1 Tax=Saccostrea cuccullata TaxID=36930 RepID=UPI002ED1E6CC